MKTAIVTDSGSGLNKQQADALGIYYLPLQIIVNDNMYLDGVDIQVEQIYEMLKQGEMPTTSMPPMGIIEELFHKLKKDGYEDVIAIPLTSGLSSTSSVMHAVAKECELKLHIIETYSTCNIQCYLAKCAQQLVKQEVAAEEIVKRLQDSVAHSDTLIIPNDLQHLKRGGRLTPLAATLGGLLKIKPILKINKETNGKIDVVDKVRTMHKAMDMAIEIMRNEHVDDSYMITVAHADDAVEAEYYMNKIKAAFPNAKHQIIKLVSVVGVHTGRGCQAVQYFKMIQE